MIERAHAQTHSTPPMASAAGKLSIGSLAQGHGRARRDAQDLGAALRVPGGRAEALGAPRLRAVKRHPAAPDRRRHRARPPRRRRGGRDRRGAGSAAVGDGRAASHAVLPAQSRPRRPVDDLLAAVAAFDADRLTAALWSDWGRLGPVGFLQQTRRAARRARRPGVGSRAAWKSGTSTSCRSASATSCAPSGCRWTSVGRADGDLRHAAGREPCARLQMVALLLASAGLRVLYLGTEIPPPELGRLAREISARGPWRSACRRRPTARR